jgi:hypothetical protein
MHDRRAPRSRNLPDATAFIARQLELASRASPGRLAAGAAARGVPRAPDAVLAEIERREYRATPRASGRKFSVDGDVLTVYGVKIHGDLLRTLAKPTPEGRWFRIVSVEDGVATVQERDDLVPRRSPFSRR